MDNAELGLHPNPVSARDLTHTTLLGHNSGLGSQKSNRAVGFRHCCLWVSGWMGVMDVLVFWSVKLDFDWS